MKEQNIRWDEFGAYDVEGLRIVITSFVPLV